MEKNAFAVQAWGWQGCTHGSRGQLYWFVATPPEETYFLANRPNAAPTLVDRGKDEVLSVGRPLTVVMGTSPSRKHSVQVASIRPDLPNRKEVVRDHRETDSFSVGRPVRPRRSGLKCSYLSQFGSITPGDKDFLSLGINNPVTVWRPAGNTI